MAAGRRGFLKAVAIAPLTPLAPTALAGAELPPAAPATDAVAGALAEAVRLEHGAHLDASALARVKKEIAQGLESAARLRAAARLGNADEPVTLFAATPPVSSEDRR